MEQKKSVVIKRKAYYQLNNCNDLKLEDYFKNDNMRYFSYGRYALLEGLILAGVKAGSKVLLPQFICRDIIPAITSIGASPIYYRLNSKLELEDAPEGLPEAEVILAVNYFGFPQNLLPFREYCRRTGAILIEDNAHGLFSRDDAGELLGTRGDIGIFSLRKTIDIPNGAALILNSGNKGLKLKKQISFTNKGKTVSFVIKKILKKTIPFLGTMPIEKFIYMVRISRKLFAQYKTRDTRTDAELYLLGEPYPYSSHGSLEYSIDIDIEHEIWRRREVYVKIGEILEGTFAKPIFSSLPNGVVPYSYPIVVATSNLEELNRMLKCKGLVALPWPDLPKDVCGLIPNYFKNIRSVQLIC